MKIACIIPARYASTRFPGKPLAKLGDKPMIQHVYEKSREVNAFDFVAVATDSQLIYDAVMAFGGKAIFTSEHHQSGTDRIAEAVINAELENFDYIVNVQGDEPLIEPAQIEELIQLLDGETEIATLIKQISNQEDLFNPNVVKAVVASNQSALYFSRHPIPYLRGVEEKDWLSKEMHFKHVGMYAYKREVLMAIGQLTPSPLENAESLEQLRWLENGFQIKAAQTAFESIGIDTPEDLLKAIERISKG
jgi:3-deoxy-manno-octulosonate cytidylyltransferase (CMP-KDO synthetase)